MNCRTTKCSPDDCWRFQRTMYRYHSSCISSCQHFIHKKPSRIYPWKWFCNMIRRHWSDQILRVSPGWVTILICKARSSPQHSHQTVYIACEMVYRYNVIKRYRLYILLVKWYRYNVIKRYSLYILLVKWYRLNARSTCVLISKWWDRLLVDFNFVFSIWKETILPSRFLCFSSTCAAASAGRLAGQVRFHQRWVSLYDNDFPLKFWKMGMIFSSRNVDWDCTWWFSVE